MLTIAEAKKTTKKFLSLADSREIENLRWHLENGTEFVQDGKATPGNG